MKFLCDEMLKGLARWLRTAGYDVVMEPDGTGDRPLIERALEGNGLEDCAREVTQKLGVNWLLNPFSRCSLCNTPLIETERPPDFPPDIEQVFICPSCDKYYWHGGHVERMRHRLERWQGEFR